MNFIADLIHPTAFVHPNAILGSGTRVGAYSIIGPDVRTGENCVIQEHVVIRGKVTLGNRCQLFPFSIIGCEPSHGAYRNEETEVVVGDDVIFRERVTVERGTQAAGGVTRIGNNCGFMDGTHIAHDCSIGNHVVTVGLVILAGHVTVEDFVFIGGLSFVAQRVRIGKYCFIGASSSIRKDLPPFIKGKGNKFRVQGINVATLKEHGFTTQQISEIKSFFRMFYLQNLTVNKAIEQISNEFSFNTEAQLFLSFVKTSKLGVHR